MLYTIFDYETYSDSSTEIMVESTLTEEQILLAQDIGLQISQKHFMNDNNAIDIMTEYGTGSFGEANNVAQIIGVVGQHYYCSHPLKPKPCERILPTFRE